ncbi:MAG: alpha/beta hydrolase family esterase, partial [Vitreimonas sp.]
MIRAIVTLVAFALGGVAQAQTYDRDIELRALTHAGLSRTAGIYVPTSYNAERPAPLIVALHGRFSSAKAFHALSGLAAVAEARGAIVLYPQTVGGFWSDGGDATIRREMAQDDTGFVALAIEAAASAYAIDRGRIFLVGYDVGGGLAYRLVCEGNVHFSGVAVASALLWDYATSACPAAAPAPMLILHGRRDDIYPVGGEGPSGLVTARRLSAEESTLFWRNRNGCGARASATARGDSVLYAECRDGAAVAYVGVEGGAHDWFRDGEGYALNRHGVDAAAAIDSFFFDRANFRLPQSRAGRRSRAWLVYAPPGYNPATPMPAVVMLHGRPSTATGMALITRMHEVAARRGFIVVYPEGIDNEWNAQFDLIGRESGRIGGMRSVLPQDDVEFLTTLMADLRVDLNIDSRRMYVAGFSNGGFMTMRMACSASDVFAGFAEVGAALYPVMTRACRGGRPAPMLFMHGTADRSIPFDGVEVADSQGGAGTTQITISVRNTV